MKKYEYASETFEVSEPKDCVMALSAKGLTIEIKLHPTNRYWDYFAIEDYGYFHNTMDAAVSSACKRDLGLRQAEG